MENKSKSKGKKLYLVYKHEKVAEYKSKKDAQDEIDNFSLWYPENSYVIVEQELEEEVCEECGKSWSGEFHASDECLTPKLLR